MRHYNRGLLLMLVQLGCLHSLGWHRTGWCKTSWACFC